MPRDPTVLEIIPQFLSRPSHHHAAIVNAPVSSKPIEVLAGQVDRVTFHNSENGFCVLRVKARGQRDPITVIGDAAAISAGEIIGPRTFSTGDPLTRGDGARSNELSSLVEAQHAVRKMGETGRAA